MQLKYGCDMALNQTSFLFTYVILSAQAPKVQLVYCWFSHDVTKIQTKKLLTLPRFYFHDALEQLKTNFHTNFRFKRVLSFVIEYAWISKLLGDATFTWRPRDLSCWLKQWLISGNFAILTVHVLQKALLWCLWVSRRILINSRFCSKTQ